MKRCWKSCGRGIENGWEIPPGKSPLTPLFSWEIPPDPPFFKGGGNVLLFSGTCRHAAEDSLRISLPFAKPQTSPPFPNPKHLPLFPKAKKPPLYQRGVGGDLTIGQRKPQTSPPLPTPKYLPLYKGGRGDFHSRQVMVETEAVMEKLYRVVVERAGDVENINPP